MDSGANFMENTTVKNILKSVNICQTYERMYSGTVFIKTRLQLQLLVQLQLKLKLNNKNNNYYYYYYNNDHGRLTERYSLRLSDMNERSPYPGRGADKPNISRK